MVMHNNTEYEFPGCSFMVLGYKLNNRAADKFTAFVWHLMAHETGVYAGRSMTKRN